MKSLIFSTLFSLISFVNFASNKPLFVIEQTNEGYEISLKMEDVSNVSAVRIRGEIIQNNYSNKVLVDLEVSDIVNQKSFQNLSLDNSHSEFVVELTDKNGNITVYPLVSINIDEEELFASK